jgi:hypothetical protein
VRSPQKFGYATEIVAEVKPARSTTQELAFPPRKRNLCLVQQRLSLASNRIGPGTIAAALAALSMAVIGHFFI